MTGGTDAIPHDCAGVRALRLRIAAAALGWARRLVQSGLWPPGLHAEITATKNASGFPGAFLFAFKLRQRTAEKVQMRGAGAKSP